MDPMGPKGPFVTPNLTSRIDGSHRTPATKAKMAERIVRTASEGVRDLHALMSAAVDEGRVPAV
jgi:hypothetical protein